MGSIAELKEKKLVILEKIKKLMEETHLASLLKTRCNRRVERKDNREIWGEENT